MKLTNDAIRKAQPGDVLRDDTVRGLHMRVFAGGKAYYLYYRTMDGKERRPKLGAHPGLTLADARTAAKALLGEVAAGKDPSGYRKALRDAPTVKDLCKQYMTDRGERRASSKERQRMIDKYIVPKIGALRVHEVDYQAIAALHSGMADAPYQANRVVSLLSTMFNYAQTLQWRPPASNPCKGVERYPERKRRRYMTGEEAVAMGELLKKYEASHPRAVLFIYLLVYTGARPDEVARFEWPMLQGNKIVLEEHKTAERTGARTVYLPPQVTNLIKGLKREGTIVGIKSPKHLWDKLRIEAGCPDLRLYDLRHSFASAALAAGYTLSQIGELLGHSSTQTTQRYAHLIDEAAHAAVSATADYLDGMMRPKARA